MLKEVRCMFLTLCERSKANYPAEAFADQLISVISNASNGLVQWHDVLAPARIAELVHDMAHRDSPMPLTLAQKFLRILDWLVDMGDRRSAALQLSESFRDVRVPCASWSQPWRRPLPMPVARATRQSGSPPTAIRLCRKAGRRNPRSGSCSTTWR